MFVELFILFICLITYIHIRRRSALPPGPFSIPIFGTLHAFMGQGAGHLLHEKFFCYKEFYSVLVGPFVFIVINDFKLAKELFSRDEFSGKIYVT